MLTSTTTNTRLDPRLRLWLVRAVAVGVTIGLLAVSTPVIWAAVSGGLGVMALATMAVGGTILFQALPWGLQRLENRLLKLRKSEARTNPIEQLQNDCLRREERLQSFRRALATIGGQIESMTQMVAERRHIDPGHVLDRQERALERMRHFYACNLRRLDDARAALEAFQHQVKQKTFEWEFAEQGRIAIKALPNALKDLVQDLLTDEALRSVRDRFNTVFAELDLDLRAADAPTRSLMVDDGLDRLGALSLPDHAAVRRLQ